MADTRPLRSVPPTPPAPPLEAPRGRRITAEGIIKRHYLDAETGDPIVTVRWVRDNMPYKEKLSHARVAWFVDDVDAIVAEARRTGSQVKDVKLEHLERKAG